MTTRSYPNSQSHARLATLTNNGGSVGTLEDGRYTEKWTDSVTFGENIKGWRQNLRDGLPATTSMSGSKVTFRYTPGRGKWTLVKTANPLATHFIEVSGNLVIDMTIPSSNPTLISSAKSDPEALAKFNQRIRDKITAFQGATFLGELASTLRTIKNPARGLRTSADDFLTVARRLRKEGLRGVTARNYASLLERTTANIADAWLELQFGWKPLLHDIDDGSKALAILNTGQGLSSGRITAKSEVLADPFSSTSPESNSIAVWQVHTVSNSHSMVIYRGALRVDAQNPAEMPARLLGFDPSSFLPTVWELIPYSFLIDYFTNIGDIVEGWSQCGIRLAWCNRTVRSSYVKTSSAISDLRYAKSVWPAQNWQNVTFAPPKVVIEKTSVVRAEVDPDSIRVPDFRLEVPGSGSLKWLNIAALVAGRLSDRNWSYGD